MNLKHFQCDRSQFKDLKPDLSCVKWYLAYKDAQAKVKDQEAKIAALQEQYAEAHPYIAAEILETAEKMLPPTQGDKEPDSDITALTALLKTINNRKKYNHSVGAQIAGVISMFTTVDIEALKHALSCVGSLEKPSDGALKGHKAQLTQAKKKLVELEESCLDVCFKPPLEGQEWAVTQEEAISKVHTFIQVWRERVVLFSVPVTVLGTQISTLPPKEQQAWKKAYTALKFHDLPKRPYYQHKKAVVTPVKEFSLEQPSKD